MVQYFLLILGANRMDMRKHEKNLLTILSGSLHSVCNKMLHIPASHKPYFENLISNKYRPPGFNIFLNWRCVVKLNHVITSSSSSQSRCLSEQGNRSEGA